MAAKLESQRCETILCMLNSYSRGQARRTRHRAMVLIFGRARSITLERKDRARGTSPLTRQ
jgi:hypothetical protein